MCRADRAYYTSFLNSSIGHAAIGRRCWGHKQDPLSSSPLPTSTIISTPSFCSPFIILTRNINVSSFVCCSVSLSLSSLPLCVSLQVACPRTLVLHGLFWRARAASTCLRCCSFYAIFLLLYNLYMYFVY